MILKTPQCASHQPYERKSFCKIFCLCLSWQVLEAVEYCTPSCFDCFDFLHKKNDFLVPIHSWRPFKTYIHCPSIDSGARHCACFWLDFILPLKEMTFKMQTDILGLQLYIFLPSSCSVSWKSALVNPFLLATSALKNKKWKSFSQLSFLMQRDFDLYRQSGLAIPADRCL